MDDETTKPTRFPELQLDFIESRVLGSLMEKQVTTPAYYPMTVNGLESACNQSSNRAPVTDFNHGEIEEAIQRLRDKKSPSFNTFSKTSSTSAPLNMP